jgi:hypothetical protein
LSNPSSSSNPPVLTSHRRVSTNPLVTEGIQIKGQMIHCPESKCLLFLGSPLVDGMDSMTSKGLFLSDIPIHGESMISRFFQIIILNVFRCNEGQDFG